MYEVSKAVLRIAGLSMMALFVAHCGDNDVHIRTGGGVNPTAGIFTGVTDEGGSILIQVGSIERIAFECDGEDISQTFSPAAQVNGDGTFSVRFTDAGREFHVTGTFSDNNNVSGHIDDEDNECDADFEASRGGAVPTQTPNGSQPTSTPLPGEPTATPLPGEPTATPLPGDPTSTPLPGDPTPTATSTPGGAATCPTLITFTGTSTGGVLDTGWTGQGHDATVISDGTATVSVQSCAGAAPNCGVCSYTGPVANATGELQSQRCSNDSAIPCTSNAPCGAGTCKFFFGSYLPLAAGGVSTCVENTFNGGITGTANVDTGTSAGTASLTSRVFSGPTLAVPCPQCVGDGTANDGTKGGTCSAGLHAGAPCDRSGSSPNAAFGPTSLDCPPLIGGVIGTLPIDLSNTTGTKSRTLSAANPSCRAIGFTDKKCQCDTCNNTAATPCSSNSDCTAAGATICGGRRCAGGANNGTACAVASECPGGACTVPGQATAANQCDDAVCSPDGGNEGTCAGGPFEQFCSPTETFRGCTSSAECEFPGDSCSLGKNRDCFDSGDIGDAVTATGQADTPTNHESDPTLAALFCIGPVSSSAVNGAAGLPGLGRLQLQGHATDNGTP